MRYLWKLTPLLLLGLVLGLIFVPQYATRSQVARAAAHGNPSASLIQADEDLLPVDQVDLFLEDLTVYLPLVLNSPSVAPTGIYGNVTVNGKPAEGIILALFNDQNETTEVMTTTTDSYGSYNFIGLPSLEIGHSYYAVFKNDFFGNKYNSDLLNYYFTPPLNTYTEGTDVFLSDFDIGDIVLKTPKEQCNELVPIEFTWERRLATRDDSYQWELYSIGYEPIYSSPLLDYTGSYTLNNLPLGAITGTEYKWEVWVYSPDGGYGVSNELRKITFSSGGGIYGSITAGGDPAECIALSLWQDHVNIPVASTTTSSDGNYWFSDIESLAAGESYYVVYQNTVGDVYSHPDLLWYYVTPSLDTYTAGSDAFLSDFDLADIVLKTPPDFSIDISVPVEFTWERRPATPQDSYQWALNTKNYDPIFASPELGYVGSYTLQDLPAGIIPGPLYDYQWEVWVYTPDGGYGLSYQVFWLTFAD